MVTFLERPEDITKPIDAAFVTIKLSEKIEGDPISKLRFILKCLNSEVYSIPRQEIALFELLHHPDRLCNKYRHEANLCSSSCPLTDNREPCLGKEPFQSMYFSLFALGRFTATGEQLLEAKKRVARNILWLRKRFRTGKVQHWCLTLTTKELLGVGAFQSE